jgi:hypothetical protein
VLLAVTTYTVFGLSEEVRIPDDDAVEQLLVADLVSSGGSPMDKAKAMHEGDISSRVGRPKLVGALRSKADVLMFKQARQRFYEQPAFHTSTNISGYVVVLLGVVLWLVKEQRRQGEICP